MKRLLFIPLFPFLFLFISKTIGQSTRIIPQSGHKSRITDMVISPDGKNLITCSSDQSLIWDIKTGFHYTPLETGGLFCLAISPDGQYLAGFKEDEDRNISAKLVVAKLPEGKIMWEVPFSFNSKGEIQRNYGLTFTNDSRRILSVTLNEYQLWEVNSGTKLVGKPLNLDYDNNYNKNLLRNIIHPILSTDNNQFAVKTNDDEIGIYHTLSGEPIRILNKNEESNKRYSIYGLAYLNSAEIVASYSSGNEAKISWDTRSGRAITNNYQLHPYNVINKETFLVVDFDSLHVLDMATLRLKLKMPWEEKVFGGEYNLFSISPASDFVAVYYFKKNEIHIYSLISGKLIKKLSIFNPVPVNGVAFTPEGNLIFQTGLKHMGGDYDKLWYFNLHTLGEATELRGVHDDRSNHRMGTWTQVFDPTGEFLYYIDDYSYGKHNLYAKALDKPEQEDQKLTTQKSFPISITISPDGRWLDCGSTGAFDLTTQQLFPGPEEGVYLFSSPATGNSRPLKINTNNYLVSDSNPEEHYCICGIKTHSNTTSSEPLQLKEVSNGLLQLACGHQLIERRINGGYYFTDKGLLFVHRNDHIQRPNKMLVFDIVSWKTIAEVEHESLDKSFWANPVSPMLISTDPGKAYFWDPITGQIQDSITNLSTQSNALAISKDLRLLAVSTFDGSVEIWDLKKGKKEATVLTLEGDGYLIFTPDGYYSTNKNSGRVCFQINGELFPLEVFDIQYNRPDVVLERLGIANPESIQQHRSIVQKRLQKMGITLASSEPSAFLPEMEIKSQLPALETTNGIIPLYIQARDKQTPLAFLQILVNEVPVYSKGGYRLDEKTRYEFQQEFNVELSPGKNIIQVYVTNQNGHNSPWQTIETHYIGPKPASDLHLVSIGVSRYQDNRMNLNFARKDAEDVVKLFKSRPGSFRNIHTYEFYDERVTRQNFLNLRAQLLNTNIHDRVIIFIAGHGLRDKSLDYYLATHDVNFAQPSEKGIAFDQVEGLLDGIPARQKVIFIDACHSGEVDKEEVELVQSLETAEGKITFRSFGPAAVKKKAGQLSSFDLMKNQFVDLRRSSGAVVISAAGGAEFALESDAYSNGVFTFSLLSGLTEMIPGKYEKYKAHLLADANANQQITVSELRQYLFQKVPELTQGRQQPTTRVDYLYNDFVLWEYNPGQGHSGKNWGSEFEFTTAEELERLLNSGISVNEKDNNGATLLMYSLLALNDVKWLRRLVDLGADPKTKGTIFYDRKNRDNYYGSLLAVAAANGNLEAVQYLIETCKIPVDDKEYDSKSKTDSGWTALQWAASNGHNEVVSYLLQKGASINMQMDNSADTPLMLASQKGHASTVNLLLARGANPQITSAQGWNALHGAARGGQAAVIPDLIKTGLSVDQQTADGWTPAMLAAISQHYACFGEILKWNPNLELKTKDGKTLLDLAAEYKLRQVKEVMIYQGREKALFYKIKEKDRDAVLGLLEKGADINETDAYGANLFAHIVWEFQELELIKSLAKYRPDLNPKGVIWIEEPGGGFYGNLQCLAVGIGKMDILRYFLEDLQLPVDGKEYDPATRANTSWTALQWACSARNLKMIKYLLEAGANCNLVDQDGKTLLMLAEMRNDWEVSDLLRKHCKK